MTAEQWQGPAVNPRNSRNTEEITCPRCDYGFGRDSWEFLDGHGEIEVECPECELWFTVEAEYSVTYTSRVRAEE